VDETGSGYDAGAVKEHARRPTAAWHVPVVATLSVAIEDCGCFPHTFMAAVEVGAAAETNSVPQ